MTEDAKFLVKAVKKAAKMITNDFEVKAKDEHGDLVTNFDYAIEKYIINCINKKYPNFDIVSEEFNAKKEPTDNCFIIDPIDGTVNFAHGLPTWGIQVACIKGGEVVASVIYLPKFKEVYFADQTGAYLNNKKINVKPMQGKQNMVVVESGNRDPSRIRVQRRGIKTRAYGVACLTYAWVASGKLTGMVFKQNKYWDYVPGQFLVKQAGGYIIDNNNCHVAAADKELAEILAKECQHYEDDNVTLNHD